MPMPPPPPEQGRIDLGELKSQITRQLGPDRARCYFGCLNRLLAQKLSKLEFQRYCLLTLGRENIPLHNQLVLSIFKNACLAKAPPPSAPSKPIGKKSNHMSRLSPAPAMPLSARSNGDILPMPSRKVRSSIRDRIIKDRPSPLGVNGKAHVAASQSSVHEVVVRENGGVSLCDLKRPVQCYHDRNPEQLPKRLRVDDFLPHDKGVVHIQSVVEAATVEKREEAGHDNDLNSDKSPLQAPLGIPFCSASIGGAKRSLPLVSIGSYSSFSTNYDSSNLCHTEELRRRMQRIAKAQGLGEVTMDCANLLNNGLDAYLKRLIHSCVDLVGARLGCDPLNRSVSKQQPHGKQRNGIWPANHIHAQGSERSSEVPLEQKNRCSISLLDFKVAMELNPQQLGEDWPLLLEKIYFHSSEE